jgi:serine/threonine protein kinase
MGTVFEALQEDLNRRVAVKVFLKELARDPKFVKRFHREAQSAARLNYPNIRVRDFGSLNGTRVNGKLIGKRDKEQTPEEGQQLALPEHDLKHGDTVRLRSTVFQVSVHVPPVCEGCSEEIAVEDRRPAEVSPGRFVCLACRQKAKTKRWRILPTKNRKICVRCRNDVAAELSPNRQGQYVCASCRARPFEILKPLLRLAKSGRKDLTAIEGYAVVKELGRGGMGAVYLVRHERTGELVALKVMMPKVAMDAIARRMFLREAANTRVLKHENIVEFRSFGCSNGIFFCAVEFCDGGSVQHLMNERGGILPVDEAVAIATQCLDGLEYAAGSASCRHARSR